MQKFLLDTVVSVSGTVVFCFGICGFEKHRQVVVPVGSVVVSPLFGRYAPVSLTLEVSMHRQRRHLPPDLYLCILLLDCLVEIAVSCQRRHFALAVVISDIKRFIQLCSDFTLINFPLVVQPVVTPSTVRRNADTTVCTPLTSPSNQMSDLAIADSLLERNVGIRRCQPRS